MFRDEAEVMVQAGRGGNGVVSFRREKYVPRGGPDGGDGGAGGSVILVADAAVSSLFTLARNPHLKAEAGRPGGGANRTGRSGRHLRVHVPVGTMVLDAERGHLLKDLAAPGDEVVVAAGGWGGRGNTAFATAEHRTPRVAEEGRPGENRRLRLELKLIADVGLLGLPNAGKSTLLSRISAARPKVADYPFTTLSPVLGLVALDLDRTFVVADLPGLIAGAHQGHGLGDRFLRHVERTRLLLHLVDSSSLAGDPMSAYQTVRQELAAYSPLLAGRESLVAATKLDDPAAAARADALEAALGRPILRLSAVTGQGLPELLQALAARLFPGPG